MKAWFLTLGVLFLLLGCQDDPRQASPIAGGEAAEEGGEANEEGGEAAEEGGEAAEEGGEAAEEGGEANEEGGEANEEGGDDVVSLGLEAQEGNPDLEHPAMELPPESAASNRITIGMLEHSIPVVAGNLGDGTPINWTVFSKGQVRDAWEYGVLGRTLGKPDYVTVTNESTDPDMLYAKFMTDMAQHICDKMRQADTEAGTNGDRVLTRYVSLTDVNNPAAIAKNLAYLKLRFHGVKVSDTDTETLAPLQALYDGGAVGNGTMLEKAIAGWNAVCVGLFLSPEFHIY